MQKIPLPSIERLCVVYGLLEKVEKQGVKTVSSNQIGKRINTTRVTVRKDISYLCMPASPGKDYEVTKLKKYIENKLKLLQPRKVCVIGLGRIGTAILAYEYFREEGFDIVAGFDANLNKIERIVTKIPLYLVNDLTAAVVAQKIEIAILCVPPEFAQQITDILVISGIKGILNCTTAVINVPEKVFMSNIDFTSHLRTLSANIALKTSAPVPLR